jgi:hypothetical protein
MKARRKSLHHVKVQTCTHAGLWLDKFLTVSDGRRNEGRAGERKAKG